MTIIERAVSWTPWVWNYDPIFRGLKHKVTKLAAGCVLALFGTMTRFLGD